jgi:excinuclease ABC subunit A
MGGAASSSAILLRNVRVNNLRGIDLDLPRGSLIVVTGPSGAGKSSLVRDTLAVEGRRRYIETLSVSSRVFLEKLDRPAADRIEGLPPAVLLVRSGRDWPSWETVGGVAEVESALAVLFAREGAVTCYNCGHAVAPATPESMLAELARLPEGAKYQVAFPVDLRPETDRSALAESLRAEGFLRVNAGGGILLLEDGPPPDAMRWEVIVDRQVRGRDDPSRVRESLALALRKGLGRALALTDGEPLRFAKGWSCSRCGTPHIAPEPALFRPRNSLGACPACAGRGADESGGPCLACGGRRLRPEALAVRVEGRSIADVLSEGVAAARDWIRSRPDGEGLRGRAERRLAALIEFGLGGLPLDRPVRQVSRGEARRLGLAQVLGLDLVNLLITLDEVAEGLHPEDVVRLIPRLRDLAAGGHTVVCAGHDELLIAAADWVVRLGPGAGADGGRVVAQGPPAEHRAEVVAEPELPPDRPAPKSPKFIHLKGASGGNLQGVDLKVPLGGWTSVAGVSGSGKHLLVAKTLVPALRAQLLEGNKPGEEPLPYGELSVPKAQAPAGVVWIDASPRRQRRSIPATVLHAFGEIRAAFAETAEAKGRRYGKETFRLGGPGGRCEACKGEGAQEIDMVFLPDVRLACPECGGTRYRREVLDVKLRGKSIAEVLDLTAREAFGFFRARPKVQARLRPLLDVGLDYLRLGQPCGTLSSGESRRLGLASHLASTPAAVTKAAARASRFLYAMDEPSAGLAPEESALVARAIRSLVDLGNTVVVITHDPHLMRASDHLVELGPGGGREGGRILAQGPPESVKGLETPTGRLLAGAGRMA